ncbi:MAG: hypothetical protein C4291_06120 [Candidatus Dadabacteria bacterium]
MRVIIILIIMAFGVSGYGEAQDWIIDDLYRDTPRVLMLPTNPIDLRFKKESNGIEYREREKTLKEDFHEFIKENLYTYMMLWSIRTVYDPENVRAVFTPSSFRRWLTNNINGWQGCNGKAASRSQCSVRKPFTAFPLWDGDYLKTNLAQHPIFGAGTYLYYRARGYDRAASSLASFELSALYEYTVEGWMQPPSLTDLILTPGLGVPLGMALEETSNLLAKSDSQFIRGLSYIVNPARIFIPNGEIAWNTLIGRTITLRFSW